MKRALSLCLAILLAGAAAQAAAQAWPAKPVKLIVPANPGGGTADPISRFLAEELSKTLGVRMVVESRPGANGNIGAAAAAQAAPDGYTLLFSWAGTLATNTHLYRNMQVNPRRDLLPIVYVGNVPNILVVNASVPLKTLSDFTAYVKGNPKKLNYGSSGNGSSMHLAAALYMQRTGTEMVHVPYNSVPKALNDLLTGDIQLMFQLVPGVLGLVKSGKLRAIAIMADHRFEALPDVPTFAEAGMPGLATGTWFGFLAPVGTPPAVIARVNADVNKVLKDPSVRARLVDMGLEPGGGTPKEFADFWDREIARWGEVVRFTGVKLD
jgi:tripartite-type tricarboxylate transporter receptor subunit TctC